MSTPSSRIVVAIFVALVTALPILFAYRLTQMADDTIGVLKAE